MRKILILAADSGKHSTAMSGRRAATVRPQTLQMSGCGGEAALAHGFEDDDRAGSGNIQ